MFLLLFLQGTEYFIGRQWKAIIWLQPDHLGSTAKHKPKNFMLSR